MSEQHTPLLQRKNISYLVFLTRNLYVFLFHPNGVQYVVHMFICIVLQYVRAASNKRYKVSGNWLPLVVCPIIVADLHNCHIHLKKTTGRCRKRGLNSLLNLFMLFRTVCHLWLILQSVKKENTEGGERIKELSTLIIKKKVH